MGKRREPITGAHALHLLTSTSTLTLALAYACATAACGALSCTRVWAQAAPVEAASPEPAPPPAAPAPSAQPAPSAAPAPPPFTATDALKPTEEDYATAQGNVPAGVKPREFHFDSPRFRPHSELGMSIGIPIWFTSAARVIEPGLWFEGRFAHRIGLVAPEFSIGWQVNWIDDGELPSSYRRSSQTIESLFFGAGVRFYMIDGAVVSPYISGALDLEFWHFSGDTDKVCGYYYCRYVAHYDPGLGLSSRFGLAIAPSPRFQLDIAARLAMVLPIGPFDSTQAWLAPYLGFLWLI